MDVVGSDVGGHRHLAHVDADDVLPLGDVRLDDAGDLRILGSERGARVAERRELGYDHQRVWRGLDDLVQQRAEARRHAASEASKLRPAVIGYFPY